MATSLDNSPTKSDQHPTTEDGESSEAWYVVDMEEVSQSLDQDPAEPRHETQDSTQPSIASAVRVLSQSPIEWLAGRIFLLLDGMLTHDTSQSTHKQPEKLPSSSDVSAATQTPYTGAMRMHQDCTSEEGLKLVLANPLEYLQSLLDAIGRPSLHPLLLIRLGQQRFMPASWSEPMAYLTSEGQNVLAIFSLYRRACRVSQQKLTICAMHNSTSSPVFLH